MPMRYPFLNHIQLHSLSSDLVVVKDKANISRPLRVVSDEVIVSLRPFLLRVTREHALQADTYALDVVYWRPALSVKEVEADDAVGVDVRVPGYGMGVVLDEDYFGGLRQ